MGTAILWKNVDTRIANVIDKVVSRNE